jgi:hypothetical protein
MKPTTVTGVLFSVPSELPQRFGVPLVVFLFTTFFTPTSVVDFVCSVIIHSTGLGVTNLA